MLCSYRTGTREYIWLWPLRTSAITNTVLERSSLISLLSLRSCEKLYHKITTLDVKLPEAAKRTFYLIQPMYQKKEKLARTTCGELTYKNMRDKIMRIFGNPSATEDKGRALPVKDECMFGFGRKKYPEGYKKVNSKKKSKGTFQKEGREQKCIHTVNTRKPSRMNP